MDTAHGTLCPTINYHLTDEISMSLSCRCNWADWSNVDLILSWCLRPKCDTRGRQVGLNYKNLYSNSKKQLNRLDANCLNVPNKLLHPCATSQPICSASWKRCVPQKHRIVGSAFIAFNPDPYPGYSNPGYLSYTLSFAQLDAA